MNWTFLKGLRTKQLWNTVGENILVHVYEGEKHVLNVHQGERLRHIIILFFIYTAKFLEALPQCFQRGCPA